MKRMKIPFRSTILVLVMLSLGCESLPDNNPNRSRDSATVRENTALAAPGGRFVEYQLDWNREGVEFEETWWRTTNNLGYEVTVEGAWIVTYSAAFIPCQSASANPLNALDMLGHRIASLFVPRAWAGHGDVADPSALGDGLIEEIGGDRRIVRIGPIPSATYCDIHYLIAQGDSITQTLQDAPEMKGISLRIVGSFKVPNGHSELPLSVTTNIAYGVLNSSVEMGARISLNEMGVIDDDIGLGILIERPMAKIFDELALDELNERSIARGVLKNLLFETRFTVYP